MNLFCFSLFPLFNDEFELFCENYGLYSILIKRDMNYHQKYGFFLKINEKAL